MALNRTVEMRKRYGVQRRHIQYMPSIIALRVFRGRGGELRGQVRHADRHRPDVARSARCRSPRRSRPRGRPRPVSIPREPRRRVDSVPRRTQFLPAMLGSRLDLARRLEGGDNAPDPSTRWAASTTTNGSSTTPTSTGPRSCNTQQRSDSRELINIWFSEAGTTGPCRSTTAHRSRSSTGTPRRSPAGPAIGTSTGPGRPCEMASGQHAEPLPFAIGALVDIPAPGAEGVIFSMGSRFGGPSLYV